MHDDVAFTSTVRWELFLKYVSVYYIIYNSINVWPGYGYFGLLELKLNYECDLFVSLTSK